VALAELRRRYVKEGIRVPRTVRMALLHDPRAGARELGHGLARRRCRAAAELRRLRTLYRIEWQLQRGGVRCVAGVDEVGVGPLAGPVVAAAVVLPARVRLSGLRDSKKLSAAARERLDREIREVALDLSLGQASRAEIDRLNIYHASLLAMRRALEGLATRPDMVLVDARRIPGIESPQRSLIGGDDRVACIAAASIVAKVQRDQAMHALDQRYPGYGFSSNVGYGTAEHLAALRSCGPTPEHRHSFAPVREMLIARGGA